MAQTRLHEELPCKSASHGDLEMPPSERRFRELPFSHAARPVACTARSLAGGPLRGRQDCPPRRRLIKALTSPGLLVISGRRLPRTASKKRRQKLLAPRSLRAAECSR